MKEEDLKIELRAVIYIEGSNDRVLEYRFSPDQDLSYEVEPSGWWQRLRKKWRPSKFVEHYDTYWKRPKVMSDNSLAYLCDKDASINRIPIWVRDKKEFEHYKNKFKTYGDLVDWVTEWNRVNVEKWRNKRMELLGDNSDWY